MIWQRVEMLGTGVNERLLNPATIWSLPISLCEKLSWGFLIPLRKRVNVSFIGINWERRRNSSSSSVHSFEKDEQIKCYLCYTLPNFLVTSDLPPTSLPALVWWAFTVQYNISWTGIGIESHEHSQCEASWLGWDNCETAPLQSWPKLEIVVYDDSSACSWSSVLASDPWS